MLYLSWYFQLEVNTGMCLRRVITLQADSCHNFEPPANDLHKLLRRYIIYIDVSLYSES